MRRRSFLAAMSAAWTCRYAGAAEDAPPVTSDVGRLRRVLVHAPGPETRQRPAPQRELSWAEPAGPLPEVALEHHRALVDHLRGGGAEVLELRDLVADAIDRAAHTGQLVPWVARTAPAWLDSVGDLTADALIEGRAMQAEEVRTAYPLECLMFARDLAVMTPRGLVLGQFLNRDRAFEASVLALALRWSPRLRDVRVAYDAVADGVYLQGGDLMVLDERTLLLGVGNLTEPRAAARLAKRLKLDVVSVRLPGDGRFGLDLDLDGWNGLRTLMLHLDSVCTLVGPREAVIAPYFFEADHARRDPSRRLAGALGEVLGDPRSCGVNIRDLGRVRVYRAGTGAAVRGPAHLKLADYLRERGFRLHHAGGPAPERVAEEHLATRVLPELIRQAANVVAIAPGKVVAYGENPHTLQGLRDSEIAVTTVPGSELARWHGGPHCLTLPLSRAPLEPNEA